MAVSAVPARGDTVFLKNGNQVEGVVKSQTASEVEVDIGYGSVTLQRSDIAKIHRAPNKEIARRQFEAGLKFPAQAGSLNALYQAAKDARDKAHASKSENQDEQESGGDALGEIKDLKRRRDALMRNLALARPQADPERYNRLVADVNTVSARLSAAVSSAQNSAVKEQEGDPSQSAYANALASLEEYLKSDDFLELSKDAKGWEADYYAWAKGEARKMRAEFTSDSVRSEKRGPHIIVTATINGTVTARLMVDTGATVTVLNKNISDLLKLPASADAGNMKVTLADGRAEEVKAVRLDSLEVGKSRVDGSLAALSGVTVPGADGLLGMSFLKHFQFRIDSTGGTLILEELK